MIVSQFPSGPFATNAYILTCPETKKAAFVDPAPESADTLIAFVLKHGLHPDKILITHSHWDHIADTEILRSKYQIPVYIHTKDAENLMNPGTDGLPCWVSFPGVVPSGNLEEGQNINVGTLELKVIHTPGHTPGGVCLYCARHHFLLSGDTFFKGTIGNLTFPTAQPHLMWNSLKKVAALPADTIVYSGHGPQTTIGQESWLSNAENIFGNH